MDAASWDQIFEKTIAGMYLGEIAQRALLNMAEEGDLFCGSVPQKPSMPFVIGTPDLCAMCQDNTDDLQTVGSTLYDVIGASSPCLKFQPPNQVESNLNSRKIVLEVCDTIVKRSGRLAGAGIVRILQKLVEDSKGAIFGKRTVVAMEGGLYESYPQYRKYLKRGC
ncbi:hypothetical protein DITRI_Ditri10aG0015500 [Diplodiscus trichospermus]